NKAPDNEKKDEGKPPKAHAGASGEGTDNTSTGSGGRGGHRRREGGPRQGKQRRRAFAPTTELVWGGLASGVVPRRNGFGHRPRHRPPPPFPGRDFLSPDRSPARLRYYGARDGRELERDQRPPAAGGRGGLRGLGGAADAAQRTAAAPGGPAPGPAAAGAHRRLRRHPGGVPGGLGAPGRVSAPAG